MTTAVTNRVKAATLVALGIAIATMGVYVSDVDDAPGAMVLAFVLLAAAVVLAVRAVPNRLPTWAGRTALAVGVLVAGFTAYVLHDVTVTAPLFSQASSVPSVTDPAPSPSWAAAVDRAQPLVRDAVVAQNLPGLSVAVGVDGSVTWAEGFGWRDVVTRTAVTPATRFNIGTAAAAVGAVAASLGLTSTGTDSTTDWSPGHIGEPEEDFPGFTAIHNFILRPIGLADPARPLPGDRATFYVPRSDDHDPRQGRRLMYMRDLACCPNRAAFYSTPSDLVRFALATSTDNLDGQLAGGTVMTLIARRDKGIAVAVASNIAYAQTAALAAKVADVFAGQK